MLIAAAATEVQRSAKRRRAEVPAAPAVWYGGLPRHQPPPLPPHSQPLTHSRALVFVLHAQVGESKRTSVSPLPSFARCDPHLLTLLLLLLLLRLLLLRLLLLCRHQGRDSSKQAAGSSSACCRLQWCSAIPKLVSLTPHKYTSPLHLLNLSSLSRDDCVVLNANTCDCDTCVYSPELQH